MCPERERYQREVQQRLSPHYELTPGGTVDHRRAVKDYSRSSADQVGAVPAAGRAKVRDVKRATSLWGDCPDMCPERERYQREVQQRLSPHYELTPGGTVDHRRAVKDYSRSSADQVGAVPAAGRAKVSDVERATSLWGDCPDMCPERERYQREVQQRLSPHYELTPGGTVDHRRAVKGYSQSSADQEEPLPHEMRAGPVLRLTMDYLLWTVVNEPPSDGAALSSWYNFLWDRTRSIRKDMTQQQLTDATAVWLMETCTRFHIFAGHHLAHLDIGEFDPRMNTENLTKCLQSLRHLYEDMRKSGVVCPNEPEFRAYDVLLNLNDPNVLRQVMNYGEGQIRQSADVRLAITLFLAAQSNNYVRFFKLITQKATYLQACLAHRHFGQIRLEALKTVSRGYKLCSELQELSQPSFVDE